MAEQNEFGHSFPNFGSGNRLPSVSLYGKACSYSNTMLQVLPGSDHDCHLLQCQTGVHVAQGTVSALHSYSKLMKQLPVRCHPPVEAFRLRSLRVFGNTFLFPTSDFIKYCEGSFNIFAIFTYVQSFCIFSNPSLARICSKN